MRPVSAFHERLAVSPRRDDAVLLIQLTGGLLIALVACQLAVLVVSSLWRLFDQRQRDRVSLELLRQQVEAAAWQRRAKEQTQHLWEGWRKFVVQRKVEEGCNITSFYLTPHDRKPLPAYAPGQFLTFRLQIPGQARPVIRCYSISDSPHPECYRVTIKKVPPLPDRPDAPPGLVSTFFHDQVKVGDILDVQAPRGQFVLDPARATPVVMIAGGIGLTPLLCMLNALADRNALGETWLFYGVRNGSEHIMKDHLRRLAQEHPRFRLRVCYSRPAEQDVNGKDYDVGHCITLDLLKAQLPSSNYEFYICGPPGMMAALTEGLKAWGVPEAKIFTEAFGPASVPKSAPPAAGAVAEAAAPRAAKVTFARSNRTAAWDPQAGNLLSLAQASNVEIPSGCCAGNCGTCETAIKAGTVRYLREPGWKAQAGTCLVCVAAPNGDVELDA